MATVVNNPAPSNESNTNWGMIIMAIVLLVIAILFILYGLPMLRRTTQQTQVPNITVPEQIDVNVQTEGQGE